MVFKGLECRCINFSDHSLAAQRAGDYACEKASFDFTRHGQLKGLAKITAIESFCNEYVGFVQSRLKMDRKAGASQPITRISQRKCFTAKLRLGL